MRVTVIAAALCCVLLVFAGCTHSGTVIETQPLTLSNLVLPASFQDGETGEFAVDLSGGAGPYTLSYTFTGGSVDPPSAIHTLPSGTLHDSLSVAFNAYAAADTLETFVISVTDALGTSAELNGSFIVPKQTGPANQPPAITASSLGDGVVEVTVDDPEGDDVTVKLDTLADGSGIDVTPGPPKVVKGGHGTVQLSALANQPFRGESGAIDVLAGDANGGKSQQRLAMQAKFHWPKGDALYAIPQQTTAHVGEPVLIVIATSPTAQPFRAAAVRLTVDSASGYHYVDGSFNIGLPGGAIDNADGVWAAVQPSGFFDSWDGNGFQQYIDFGAGLSGSDFSVVPFGGQDVPAAAGAIFNIMARFETPGAWKLGFQQINVVDRTYYQDGSQGADYYWSDISNNTPGIPNTVTVVP